MATGFIDPFGAPEHWIDAVHREIASPGVLRVHFGAVDGSGDAILRVKLLVPLYVMERERRSIDDFLAAQGPKLRLVSAT